MFLIYILGLHAFPSSLWVGRCSLKHWLQVLDVDGDGFVSKEDLKGFLGAVQKVGVCVCVCLIVCVCV